MENVYPKSLKGTKTNGEEISLDLCPEDSDSVRESFGLTEVRTCDFYRNLDQHHNAWERILLKMKLFQTLTPNLRPCVRYISRRGFDRIITLILLSAGGFISDNLR